MTFDINKLIRNNIKNMSAYSSARSEFEGNEGIFLDANENAYGSPLESNYNRYPDPLQVKLKQKISEIKKIPVKNIFIGNGSDEAIDLLFRIFCEPAIHNSIICPPTYGMYEVCANINNVGVKKVLLSPDTFQLQVENILTAIDEKTRLIFVCCPNNPTGNGVKWADIKSLLEQFNGLIVVDEAYIDFADYDSLIPELKNYPNLVILQTLSKAWGLAGLRIGMAFASESIIKLMNKVKPPYNINSLSQQLAIQALNKTDSITNWIQQIKAEREILINKIKELSFVLKIYPSQANFFLVKVGDALAVYQHLLNHKIIVRNRSRVELCEGCLRITVGTPEENKQLLNTLKTYHP